MVFKSTFADIEPSKEFGDSLSVFYWHQLDKFANNTLLVDHGSGRCWTGTQIKQKSARIAGFLVEKLKLVPNESNCVFFTANSDYTHLAALAVILAGGSVCAGSHLDPLKEQQYMLDTMSPPLVFIDSCLLDRMIKLKRDFNYTFELCVINDQESSSQVEAAGKQVLGLSRDLLSTDNNIPALSEPVQVKPNSPAYVIFTSGSTGHPKPVARTHRNSLYVCHSLNMQPPLWDLNEQSVLSNHVPLDHGTGTFCVKMMLSKGLKLVVMENYELNKWLDAVEQHKITDVMLGSAYLHILMGSAETSTRQLSSLRNLMAVGSRLVSHELACEFMDRWPEVRVRQTLGMTEVGFLSMVSRETARTDNRSVGLLLPNLRIKILDISVDDEQPASSATTSTPEIGREIGEFNSEGELMVAGPTVSPGYMNSKFAQQSASAFLPDGFYRSHDLCRFTVDHRLIISGRRNDVLCIDDGWKVLPGEIEQVILAHPGISQVVVVGMPHPTLAGCHAPRAYVVPSVEGDWRNRLTENEVAEFVAQHVSETKCLTGGVRILSELPRVSGSALGKVDKRALLALP